MIAVVITMTTPYYAVSNHAGDLVIKNVPPGRYRMDVWYERASLEALQALTREVTLPADTVSTFRVVDAIQGPVGHKNKYGNDYDKAHPYGEIDR